MLVFKVMYECSGKTECDKIVLQHEYKYSRYLWYHELVYTQLLVVVDWQSCKKKVEEEFDLTVMW